MITHEKQCDGDRQMVSVCVDGGYILALRVFVFVSQVWAW